MTLAERWRHFWKRVANTNTSESRFVYRHWASLTRTRMLSSTGSKPVCCKRSNGHHLAFTPTKGHPRLFTWVLCDTSRCTSQFKLWSFSAMGRGTQHEARAHTGQGVDASELHSWEAWAPGLENQFSSSNGGGKTRYSHSVAFSRQETYCMAWKQRRKL